MRFPLAALLASTGAGSPAALGRLLHMNGSAVKQAKSDGLSALQADRYACRVGLHPSEVWSDWWQDITQGEDER